MTRRQVLALTLAVAAGITAAWLFGRHAGPTREVFVRDVSAALASIDSPEDAERVIPGCGTLRLKNGEWVCGVGVDSHSMKSAKDTLVVRDSRGRIRAFVGHVCGPKYMPRYFRSVPHMDSLDDFYAHLKELGRAEYSLPAD